MPFPCNLHQEESWQHEDDQERHTPHMRKALAEDLGEENDGMWGFLNEDGQQQTMNTWQTWRRSSRYWRWWQRAKLEAELCNSHSLWQACKVGDQGPLHGLPKKRSPSWALYLGLCALLGYQGLRVGPTTTLSSILMFSLVLVFPFCPLEGFLVMGLDWDSLSYECTNLFEQKEIKGRIV